MTGAREESSGLAKYRVLRELGRRSRPTYATVRSDGTAVLVMNRFVLEGLVTRSRRSADASATREVVTPEEMALVLREARCLAKNWHPNIARIRHVDFDEDRLIVASDLVDGTTLEHLLALVRARPHPDSSLGHALIARIVLDVLTGLTAIHGLREDAYSTLSAYHGELCPANVVVGRDGVARLIGVLRPKPVRANVWSEAVRYASPETLGEAETDARVDIYAVGVMLWEALTGRDLYEDVDPARIAQRQREDEIEAPEGPLGVVAMRALSFDPGLRYRSAHEMAASLRSSAAEISPGAAVAQAVVELSGEHVRARRLELQPGGSGERRALSPPPKTMPSGSYARQAPPDVGRLRDDEPTLLGFQLPPSSIPPRRTPSPFPASRQRTSLPRLAVPLPSAVAAAAAPESTREPIDSPASAEVDVVPRSEEQPKDPARLEAGREEIAPPEAVTPLAPPGGEAGHEDATVIAPPGPPSFPSVAELTAALTLTPPTSAPTASLPPLYHPPATPPAYSPPPRPASQAPLLWQRPLVLVAIMAVALITLFVGAALVSLRRASTEREPPRSVTVPPGR